MLAGSMAGLQGAVESCITHPEAEVMISRYWTLYLRSRLQRSMFA
jgi:hypothetical protein